MTTCRCLLGAGRWTWIAAVLSVGYAPGHAEARQATVKDSAGIVVVQNDGARWGENDRWVVLAEPVLTIGTVAGDPAYEFSLIADLTRLADGTIVVAESQTSTIRRFGPDGRFVGSSGGQGQGPGEYVDVQMVRRRTGDTLLVFDGLAQRMSFLNRDGEFLGSVNLGSATEHRVSHLQSVGTVGDSGVVLFGGSVGLRESDEGSLIQDTIQFFLFRDTGEFTKRLTGYLGAPRWGLRGSRGVTHPYVPLTARPIGAARGGTIVVGQGTRAAFRMLNSQGDLERIVRWRASRSAVNASVRSRLEGALLDRDLPAEARRSNARLLAQAPLPDSIPVSRRAIIDQSGSTWLERYRAPWERNSLHEWNVFSSTGHWLGTVTTPPRFRVYEIGDDYVLGVWWDDFDVPYVRLLALQKAP